MTYQINLCKYYILYNEDDNFHVIYFSWKFLFMSELFLRERQDIE